MGNSQVYHPIEYKCGHRIAVPWEADAEQRASELQKPCYQCYVKAFKEQCAMWKKNITVKGEKVAVKY